MLNVAEKTPTQKNKDAGLAKRKERKKKKKSHTTMLFISVRDLSLSLSRCASVEGAKKKILNIQCPECHNDFDRMNLRTCPTDPLTSSLRR